jgi:hypothetical protein
MPIVFCLPAIIMSEMWSMMWAEIAPASPSARELNCDFRASQ